MLCFKRHHCMKRLMLVLLLTGCVSTPKSEICPKLVSDPNQAFAPAEPEETYEKWNKICSPEYPLDKAKFMTAYAHGKRNGEISWMKSLCSCEEGFMAPNQDWTKRRLTEDFPKAQKDPDYKCDASNGKEEFLRGVAMGEKYAQYVKDNAWSFKWIRQPPHIVKRACAENKWNPDLE